MSQTVCAICNKGKEGGEWFTFRQAWVDSGGMGIAPVSARVHVECDEKEKQETAMKKKKQITRKNNMGTMDDTFGDKPIKFNIKDWVFPKSIMARSELESGGDILSAYGYILTRSELKVLYDSALRFIDYVGDEAIEQHNADVENRRNLSSPQVAQKEKDTSGWVYVVKIVGNNLYKIGMTTKTPDERLAQFVPKMPYEAAVVATKKSRDAFALEAKLHQMYNDLRENGEWFRLSDAERQDLITYLDNLRD